RVVIQARHVHLAAIPVFHVVADDAALFADRGDFAALRLDRLVVRAAACRPIAYGPASDRTGHRRRLAPVALAHGIAQHAANHRTQHGTGGAASAFMA